MNEKRVYVSKQCIEENSNVPRGNIILDFYKIFRKNKYLKQENFLSTK